jgi:hypothetical protein
MSNRQIARGSGIVVLIGAVVFAVHIVLRSVIAAGGAPVEYAPSAPWLAVNALGVVGAALVLLGLPALYGRMAGAAGRSGLAGMVLLALAWLFFGWFLSLYALLVQPWLAEQAPALVGAETPLPAGLLAAFVAALLAWLVGAVLLAVPFVRGHVRPRWVGWLLILAGVWMVVGNLLIAPSGPATNLPLNLLSNLGPVLLMVPLGYLGYQLWAENGEEREGLPAAV